MERHHPVIRRTYRRGAGTSRHHRIDRFCGRVFWTSVAAEPEGVGRGLEEAFEPYSKQLLELLVELRAFARKEFQ